MPVFPVWLLLLAAFFGLNLASRYIPGFADFYTANVYPLFVNTLGRFYGLFPFSVVELLLYGTVIFALYCLIPRKGFRRRACRFVTFALSLLLMYMLTCGINYQSRSFSETAGFSVTGHTDEELADLCEFLTQELNEAGREIGITEDDGFSLPENAQELAVEAMEKLGEQYPCLAGFYPEPKLLLCSRILSLGQLTGVYSPFTIEANVNAEMTAYNIPATMCHELSHLRGFMREDEANFIAFLASYGADSPQFRYSGLMLAWIYSTNALYKADYSAWEKLQGELDDGIRAELAANSVFWDRFESKIAEAEKKVNDTYLKANSQTDGVKSYDRVTDLLLAWYAKQK